MTSIHFIVIFDKYLFKISFKLNRINKDFLPPPILFPILMNFLLAGVNISEITIRKIGNFIEIIRILKQFVETARFWNRNVSSNIRRQRPLIRSAIRVTKWLSE